VDELIRELKDQGVLKSPYVEAAFRAIDRKDFVLPEYADRAYENHPLPIGEGQTISQPYTVAFMLDLLDPQPGEKILDVGAGSGWQTALLAHVVSQEGEFKSQKSKVKSRGRVYAVERIPELCDFGRANIAKYNFLKSGVVKLFCADATKNLAKEAPFDKIIAAAASAGDIPDVWRKELKVGGRIVAPVNDALKLFVKKSEKEWAEKEFPGFAFVPLISARKPTRNKNSNRLKERWHRLSVFGLMALAVILGASYPAFRPVHLAAPTTIEVATGSGLRVIGQLLKNAGLIRSKWAFVIYTTVIGQASKLKPGIYKFEGEVSVPELTRELASGRLANERLVTIPEGWDLRDIGRYFEGVGAFKAEHWWEITGEPAADYRRRTPAIPQEFYKKFEFLRDNPRGASLEGFLFPDTYRVFRGAQPEEIASRMLENFERKIGSDLRAETRRQKKTLFEVVTMASLLEKEIPDPKERRLASGILWSRLYSGMPLQVDATLNYITGKHESPSGEDFKINSPYNTYRSRGLPSGPIANPGIDAIRAAVYPEKSDYSYYLSTPEGKTIFSRTLEEHNAAKAKFLKRRG